MSEQKPAKRIVSKGEYLRFQAKRGCWLLYGSSLFVVTIGLFLLFIPAFLLRVFCDAIFALYDGIEANRPFHAKSLPVGPNTKSYTLYSIIEGNLKRAMLSIAHSSSRAFQQSKKQENIVLFTPANTADLPAPQSLVRASQEPLQAQEMVLLRAASAGAQTHEEELLRATAGGQEQP